MRPRALPVRYALRHGALLTLLWSAGGFAAQDAPASSPDEPENAPSVASQIDLDEVEDYVESTDCISLARLRRHRVVSPHTVLFYMRDGSIYLNQFTAPCPGLRKTSVVVFDSESGGRYCNMDSLKVTDAFMGVLATCYVGEFEKITEEQAEFLSTQTTRSGEKVEETVEKQ